MEKRLYRSREDRMLAGVCGGLGEYFDIDPTWIRIGWVLLFFVEGIGLLAYIICAIVIPENPHQMKGGKKEIDIGRKIEDSVEKVKNKNERAIGLILILLGLIFLTENFVEWFRFDKLWPLIVIVIGLILLGKNIRN